MESCVITSTSLNDEIQSLAANIRTLEETNSTVAKQQALDMLDRIKACLVEE